MKEKILGNTISFITKYKDYSTDEIDNLRYGLEGLYLTFTKLFFIILFSIILGMERQLLILLVLFNIIRFTGFGFHARTSLECFICSSLLFIGLPFIFEIMHPNKWILIIVGIVSLSVLSVFAPADTVKRPLINRKKRIKRKIATIIIGTVYIVLSIISNNYMISYLFITAVILESIMVSPIIYVIFKQPYNNYKKFYKA